MKKLTLVFAMSLLVVAASFAQSKDDKTKDKAKYETHEITIDKVPDQVMASLKDNGIEASNVLNVYKVKKEDSKIYKFKVNQSGEKMKYKFDASGKLLHKGAWTTEEAASAL
jgi:hypothetical protein